jgi:hypothetical protein
MNLTTSLLLAASVVFAQIDTASSATSDKYYNWRRTGEAVIKSTEANSKIGNWKVDTMRYIDSEFEVEWNSELEDYYEVARTGNTRFHEIFLNVTFPGGLTLPVIPTLNGYLNTRFAVSASEESLPESERSGTIVEINTFGKFKAPGLASVELRTEGDILGLRIEEPFSYIFNSNNIRFVPLEGSDLVLEVLRVLSIQGKISKEDYEKSIPLFD